jgi:hypothetical protein
MKRIMYVLVLVMAVLFVSGCYTERYYTRHNDDREQRYRYRDRHHRDYNYHHPRHYHRHYRNHVGIGIHFRNW